MADLQNTTPATPSVSVESEEYVLVPREPTERMLKAADGWTDLIDAAGENTAESRRSEFRVAWQAMVSAAPAPNPSPAAKSGEAEAERFDYLSDAQAREFFGAENDDELPEGRIRVCQGEWVRIPGGYYFDGSAGLLHPETATPSPQPADAMREAEEIARIVYVSMRAAQFMDKLPEWDQNSRSGPRLEAMAAAKKIAAHPALTEPAPAGEAVKPVGWQLYLKPLERWGRHINTKEMAYEAIAGYPASGVPSVRALYVHPAPEDTARLREDLERVTRAKVHAVTRAKEWLRYCRALVKRAEAAERERDDARKALETAREDVLDDLFQAQYFSSNVSAFTISPWLQTEGAMLPADRIAARSASKEATQ